MAQKPRIQICAITVKKTNVQPHIRRDPNKLYNYMIGLLLLDRIKRYPEIALIPDKRSIKVKSGNSLIDYLQIKLMFELKSKTQIQYIPMENSKALNIQFVDYICNIVWNKFERDHEAPFKILSSKINSVPLFFR